MQCNVKHLYRMGVSIDNDSTRPVDETVNDEVMRHKR